MHGWVAVSVYSVMEGGGWEDVYMTWNRLTIIDPDDPLTGCRPLAHSRMWVYLSTQETAV